MNVDKIRKQLSSGFQPFAIRASDGWKFKVPHPEFIATGRFEVPVGD